MTDSPQLDATKVAFPSDQLSIKDIRRIWPESVDTGAEVVLFSSSAGAADMLYAMLTMERDLAKATFDQNFGKDTFSTITYADGNVAALKEDLSESYIKYGLAKGQSSADQLIRRIEAQANAQAQQHLPPRP